MRQQHRTVKQRTSGTRPHTNRSPVRSRDRRRAHMLLQRTYEGGSSLDAEELQALQRRLGNQAVGQILTDATHGAEPSSTPASTIQRAPDALPPEALAAIRQRRRLYDPEEAEEQQPIVDNLNMLAELPGTSDDLFEGDTKKDDASKIKGADVYDVVTGSTGLATGTATTTRLGVDTGLSSANTTTTPGAASGTITALGGIQSGVGVGKGIYDWRKARKKRKGSGPATEQQMGWKEEKDAAKGVGTGTLGTLQSGVTSTAQFGSQAGAGWASSLMQFGVGPAAIATGSIGFLRGAYGGVRAGIKAGKIAHSRKKLKQSRRQLEQQVQNEQDPQNKEDLEKKTDKERKLEGLMSFASKRKGRKVAENALTATSGGLAVAGGALTASGVGVPVALGLFAGSAAIGLGAGAWKAGKGLYKRGKRIHKMRKLRKEMGEKRDWKWGAKQFFSGKMDKKRQKLEEAYSTYLETNQVDENKRSELAEKLRHATKTSKQRSAQDLVEMLSDDDEDVRSRARELGHQLGVLTKDGKVKKSRGFKFWKKKKDIDVEEATKREGGRENLEKLFARKLKAGI